MMSAAMQGLAYSTNDELVEKIVDIFGPSHGHNIPIGLTEKVCDSIINLNDLPEYYKPMTNDVLFLYKSITYNFIADFVSSSWDAVTTYNYIADFVSSSWDAVTF